MLVTEIIVVMEVVMQKSLLCSLQYLTVLFGSPFHFLVDAPAVPVAFVEWKSKKQYIRAKKCIVIFLLP